jgi:hypothetical protein
LAEALMATDIQNITRQGGGVCPFAYSAPLCLTQTSSFGRKLDAGQKIGCFGRIEVRVDRAENRVRVTVCKLDVSGRDIDPVWPTMIGAGLRR